MLSAKYQVGDQSMSKRIPPEDHMTPERMEYLKTVVMSLNKGIQKLSAEKSSKVWPDMERLITECDRVLKILEKS
jgi:hypothetical protein